MCFHQNHIFIQLLLRLGLISGFAVLTCAEAIVRRLLSQNNVTIGLQLWE